MNLSLLYTALTQTPLIDDSNIRHINYTSNVIKNCTDPNIKDCVKFCTGYRFNKVSMFDGNPDLITQFNDAVDKKLSALS
jgi:hypothetical protein